MRATGDSAAPTMKKRALRRSEPPLRAKSAFHTGSVALARACLYDASASSSARSAAKLDYLITSSGDSVGRIVRLSPSAALCPPASTATAYSWFIWKKNMSPQAPFWIPPVGALYTN
jgi:hypothetical protein